MVADVAGRPDAPENTRSNRKLPEAVGWVTRAELEVVLCALGIYSCYIYYGILHERLFKTTYAPDDAHFEYPTFLIGCQCVFNALGGGIPLLLFKQRKHNTPQFKFLCVSLFYSTAMLFSFKALGFMSYPMQALMKSSKMIPVMVMGIVVRRKRYTVRDFMCVGMITAGVILFSLKKNAGKGGHTETQPFGVLLLLASLFMDGLTGPYQEDIVAKHGLGTHQLMFWQNVYALFWVSLIILVSGDGPKASRFLLGHPDAIVDVIKFGVMSAAGQNFIFYTVRNISALACTTITTTRKFFTILASVVLYNHSLAGVQWLAVAMVFGGIIWEAKAKHASRRQPQKGSKEE